MLKQVIAVRSDLRLGKGKLAAQVAHASLGAYRQASQGTRDAWEDSGGKKVVVRAGSREELEGLRRKAMALGIPCSLIQDAGKTQLEPGTVTALGLGPAEERIIDSLTGRLKLL